MTVLIYDEKKRVGGPVISGIIADNRQINSLEELVLICKEFYPRKIIINSWEDESMSLLIKDDLTVTFNIQYEEEKSDPGK